MKQLRGKLKWLAAAMILLIPLIWSCGLPQDEEKLKVETTAGTIMGKENDQARLFLGVPFAAPPVGELRWKAPQDVEPWEGVLETKESRNVCVQGEMSTTWHATGEFIGDEDCLYLDVYRPKTDEENLPVYVYFHGGANRFGGASSCDGSYLAEDQNIIVVIPQYRLGPLGWLSHPALKTNEIGDEKDDSGNFGTLDNIKALEWVQNNIANLGGDPANVTIGGQSAGGSNVAKLLISPYADGLFKGAVIQSLGGSIFTPEQGQAMADAMIASLGGYTGDPNDNEALAAFLRDQDPVDLVVAHGTTYGGFSDGNVLPGGYVDTMVGGNYNDLPVMLGSTQYEWKDFMPLYSPLYGKGVWGKVYDLFDPDFDPDYKWTFDEIFPTQAEIDLYEAMGKYRSLGWKYKAVDELATLLQNRQDGVYAFFFKWGGAESASAEFAHVFGAAHAMDIPFFFGYDQDLFSYALTEKNRRGFEALQEIMMTYLGNFVRTGSPGEAAGVQWEEWSNDQVDDAPKCMILDADRKRARIGMDTYEVNLDELNEEAQAEVAGWPAGDAGLVLSMLAPYQAEYYLNDDGYDLSLNKLQFNPLPFATVDVGVNEGAGYQIEIPDGWTPGTNDLVMYAHGYRGDGLELTVTPPGRLRNYLISEGFAWAASSYTRNGYDIVSGVQSTADLLAYFKNTYGEPRDVYIVGHSMGGHITARTITDSNYKNDYVAAMPMCGVVGGAVDLFSYFMEWGLLANYFSGLNYDVPFDEAQLANFQATVFGSDYSGNGALGYIPPLGYFDYGATALLNEAGQALKTATMYRSGGKRPLYDTAFSRWATFAIQGQSLQWLVDPTAGLGTNVVGNASVIYQLDDLADESPEESDLNDGIERVSDPVYDFDAEMYAVSGEIEIPVLTLHTIGDLFVPFSMEQLWAQRIADEGHSDLFRARAIRSGNHCSFTVMEEVTAFEDLVDWVREGIVPDGDEILNPAVVGQDDFGCQFTQIVNPDYGDDPTRHLDDPEFTSVCINQ